MGRRYKTQPDAETLQTVGTVGTDVAARLRWLTDFTTRDLFNRYATHGRRSGTPGVRHDALRLQHDVCVQHSPIRDRRGDAGYSGRRTRILLRGLAPGGSVFFEPPAFPEPIAIGNGLVWREGPGILLATRGSGLSLVLAAVSDLLMAVGPKLRRCDPAAACLSWRGRIQRFCTTQCGLRVRVAQWREESATRSGRTTYAVRAEGQGKATGCARDAPKEEGSLTMGELPRRGTIWWIRVLPRRPAA